MSKAAGLVITDRQGHRIGALVFLGDEEKPCDWMDGCQWRAVAAVIPSSASAEPQFTCGSHLGRIFESIWYQSRPPRLRVVDAAPLLARGSRPTRVPGPEDHGGPR